MRNWLSLLVSRKPVKPLTLKAFRESLISYGLKWAKFFLVPALIAISIGSFFESSWLLYLAYSLGILGGVCFCSFHHRLYLSRLKEIYPKLWKDKVPKSIGLLVGTMLLSPLLYLLSFFFFFFKQQPKHGEQVNLFFRRPLLSSCLCICMSFCFLPFAPFGLVFALVPEKVGDVIMAPLGLVLPVLTSTFVSHPGQIAITDIFKGVGSGMLSTNSFKSNHYVVQSETAVELLMNGYSHQKQLSYVPITSKLLMPFSLVGIELVNVKSRALASADKELYKLNTLSSFIYYLKWLKKHRRQTPSYHPISYTYPAALSELSLISALYVFVENEFIEQFEKKCRSYYQSLEDNILLHADKNKFKKIREIKSLLDNV